jgi:UDP-glucose 4-epimerase
MRVLLIGGAGYIGSRLVSQLRQRGFDVISAGLRDAAGVDEVVDLRHAGEIYRLLLRSHPEVVVVTAYMLSRPTAAEPLRAVETNVLGITNVFQAAADFRLSRVIFASSGGIYGAQEDFSPEPVDESVHCRPRSLYAKMKLFNEWMAEHYNETTNTEFVSIRIWGPHGISGPHGTSRNTGGASAGGASPYDMVVEAAGKRDRRLRLPWARDAIFHFVHVEDAAAAFIPLITATELEHRVYNAPGFAISMGELAEMARSILNVEIEFSDPGRAINYVAKIDASRYEREFDFRPRSLATWFREEVANTFGATT